jgi:NAD-dependent SIR2 family protein deacetylase
VAAGAGMGVDSGLPDFRGDAGFWRAYPAYAKLGLGFSSLANPRWFRSDPALAWGFYGHRMDLYRRTAPHGGFGVLLAWARHASAGHFVFTSNVDGQFQRAGFDPSRVLECHGSLDALQCVDGCAGLFPADAVSVDVDPETFRARGALPSCPRCGGLARPNVLMFGDGDFDPSRTDEQEARLSSWLEGLRGAARGDVVVVECGAGTAVPSVRSFSERMVRSVGATLVRINVREPQVPAGQIGLAMGALSALQAIAAVMPEAGRSG